MKTRLIEVNVDMVHEEFDSGDLKFSLCLFNDSYEIPPDWHDDEEFMELKLDFTIDLMVKSFIENYMNVENYMNLEEYDLEKNVPVLHDHFREEVEIFKQKLQEGIDQLNRIKYIT